MKYLGLELEENKSRLIELGRSADMHRRSAGKKPDIFMFLGFTHSYSNSRNGKVRVKRTPSRKKFAKKCKEVHRQIAEMRTQPVAEIIKKLNQIRADYYHYYGITDNFRAIENILFQVSQSLFFWHNRRSQMNSYTRDVFIIMLK